MIARQAQPARVLAALRALVAPAMFRALASRAFALVWAGQTLSRIGDMLYRIAVAWWVLERTGSAAAMATLLIVSFAPTVLLLLIGGVVADRCSRVAIMFASDMLRGLVVCAVADLREGVATVFATPWLWVTVLVFALYNVTLAGPYSVALPFLVGAREGADVGKLALLYALFPLGYIIGGVWMGRRKQIYRRGALVYGGLVVAGLALGVFGLPAPLAVLAAAALINGAALELCSLAWASALQQLIPRHQLGRVSSASEFGSYALIPIGYAVAGWATELIGAPMVFLVGGGVTAAVAALVLTVHQGVRRLE